VDNSDVRGCSDIVLPTPEHATGTDLAAILVEALASGEPSQPVQRTTPIAARVRNVQGVRGPASASPDLTTIAPQATVRSVKEGDRIPLFFHRDWLGTRAGNVPPRITRKYARTSDACALHLAETRRTSPQKRRLRHRTDAISLPALVGWSERRRLSRKGDVRAAHAVGDRAFEVVRAPGNPRAPLADCVTEPCGPERDRLGKGIGRNSARFVTNSSGRG
jgi:hypothetical protein